jgi:hypothetical protein
MKETKLVIINVQSFAVRCGRQWWMRTKSWMVKKKIGRWICWCEPF